MSETSKTKPRKATQATKKAKVTRARGGVKVKSELKAGTAVQNESRKFQTL